MSDTEVLDHFFKNNPQKDNFNIVLVLDRSGSMLQIKDDVIGGTNTFIEEQRKEGGSCFFSYVQFDDQYEDVYWNKPITEVEPLTAATFICHLTENRRIFSSADEC